MKPLLASLTASSYGTVGNRSAWFGGSSSTAGREIWATDGTVNGTRLLHDLSPGPTSSYPSNFILSGGKVFFCAFSANLGTELYVVFPGATAKSIGVSCGRGQPSLAGDDPVLGGVWRLQGATAVPTNVHLFASLPGRAVTGFGCVTILDAPSMSTLFTSSTSGIWSTQLPIPNAPSLMGLPLTVQAFTGPHASAPGYAASNGLFAALGF